MFNNSSSTYLGCDFNVMKNLIGIACILLTVVVSAQDDIQELGPLPQEVWETSGLIFHNGKLITHNDSGNSPQLFEIDTTSLQLTRTVTIENATNVDWEDITQDADFIYVGDFGNNSGDRQDLKIWRISKSAYETSETVSAQRIDFIYEDQVDFSAMANSDWDAESFFSLGDHLIILTKQWQSQGTVAYRVPKLPGAFLAERIDDFQVGGLVTGSTYDNTTSTLYLIGYSQFLTPFFVQINAVQTNAIFSGEKVKTNLNTGMAQMEAITQVGNVFYSSSEEFNNASPPISSASRLFRFSLNEEIMEEEEEGPEEEENPNEEDAPQEKLRLYRSFDSKILNYNLNFEGPIFGMGIFDSAGRLVQFTPLERLNDNSVDLSVLRPSMYHLAFFYGDSIISKPFILN